jgi:hypothetical protein
MYARVDTVDIDAARADEAAKFLHEVGIPGAKSQEGFVRGLWLRSSDKSNGRGVVLFDTEEHARAAGLEGPPPGAPVTIQSVEVFEVIGEA